MKSLWGRPIETWLASTVLLLCLSAVVTLAACGGEQAAPGTDTPVPAEPKTVSAPSAAVSAATEPQPTATVAPADTLVPVPPLTPTQTPETVTTPPAAPPPTAARASTPAPAATATPEPTPTPAPSPTGTPTPTAEIPLAQTSAETDREALVTLYNATDGESWNNNDNWRSDAPIDEWHGVTTGANGRVTELNLDSNHLTGNIPPELGNLASLRGLQLYGNQLGGCVPISLQDQLDDAYTNLDDLPFCRISEAPTATPPPTQTLSERERLVLIFHATNGPNWMDNTNWLSNAPLDEWQGVFTDSTGRVNVLLLNYNQLTGEIPPELDNLANLETLDLSDNKLSGDIPQAIAFGKKR